MFTIYGRIKKQDDLSVWWKFIKCKYHNQRNCYLKVGRTQEIDNIFQFVHRNPPKEIAR